MTYFTAHQYMIDFHTIHFLYDGRPICGHKAASQGVHKDWSKVDCPDCLKFRNAPLETLEVVTPKPAVTEATKKRSPAYDDDSFMPFGKYKGERLGSVPAEYFHWLWSHRPISNVQLENYIYNNIEALRKEHPDGIWT